MPSKKKSAKKKPAKVTRPKLKKELTTKFRHKEYEVKLSTGEHEKGGYVAVGTATGKKLGIPVSIETTDRQPTRRAAIKSGIDFAKELIDRNPT